MQNATKPQIAKIHVLLSNLGITEQKIEIVYNLTNGRTQSTKDLTIDEARRLITSLAEYDPCERQKSLIFSLAYQAGIIYGSTTDDKKMNTAKLNMFLKERGAVKKELNAMNFSELVKTHRQFEAMVKAVKASNDKKQVEKELRHMLNEFDIV